MIVKHAPGARSKVQGERGHSRSAVTLAEQPRTTLHILQHHGSRSSASTRSTSRGPRPGRRHGALQEIHVEAFLPAE